MHVFEEDGEVPVVSRSLGSMRYFEFLDLPRGEYRIEVHSSLPSRLYSVEAPVRHVVADAVHEQHFELSVAISRRHISQEIARGSVVPMLLAISAALAWYYRVQV